VAQPKYICARGSPSTRVDSQSLSRLDFDMHDYDLVARSSAALLMPSITADRQVQISSCTTAMPTGAGCAELAAVSVEIDAECCCNTKQMVVCVNILGVVVCILVPEATRPDPIAEITQAIIVPSTLCVHTGHLLPVAPR
jgi:hypothetical protein